jgi:hypothetical protein
VVVFIFVLFAYVRPHEGFTTQLSGGEASQEYNNRVNGINQYLEQNYKEGNKIVVLDWAYGGLDGLLKNGALIFTPYVYDFYFYHHLSDPFILKIRSDFIERLRIEKPEFIVRVDYAGFGHGFINRETFNELEEIIEGEYVLDNEGLRYEIFKRKNE